MSGKTNKFLNIRISKPALLKRLTFTSKEEKQRCAKYLDLKGIAYHVVLINFIGLDEDGKIKYKTVSDVYKYDKRVRNRLYKYLSAFEEQMRAYIANRYNEGLKGLDLGPNITTRLNSGSNIAYELEDLDFNDLIQIVEKFPTKDLKKMFPNGDEHLIDNLHSIRELRNAISHHRILLIYDEIAPCYINGVKKNTLSDLIKNLSNLIDEYYRQFLIDEINDAVNDKRDSTFSLPAHLAIKL